MGQDNAVQRIVQMLQEMLAQLREENSRSTAAVSQREEQCKQKVAEIDVTTERVIRSGADLERALPLREEEM
jgi:hypothetical protein